MAIFKCAGCGHECRVAANQIGKKGRCPKCGERSTVRSGGQTTKPRDQPTVLYRVKMSDGQHSKKYTREKILQLIATERIPAGSMIAREDAALEWTTEGFRDEFDPAPLDSPAQRKHWPMTTWSQCIAAAATAGLLIAAYRLFQDCAVSDRPIAIATGVAIGTSANLSLWKWLTTKTSAAIMIGCVVTNWWIFSQYSTRQVVWTKAENGTGKVFLDTYQGWSDTGGLIERTLTTIRDNKVQQIMTARMSGEESPVIHGRAVMQQFRPFEATVEEYYWYGDQVTRGEWELRNR